MLVGAVILLILGGVFWLTGHDKSGIMLLVLAIVLVGSGTIAFFMRSAPDAVRLDKEWM